MSFGVEPSDGPDEEKYSTPLMLRWIARCTSDWMRSGIDARSRPAGAFILALPSEGGRLVRGGRGVPASRRPRRESRFIWLSIALISLSWPSIDCSRSAMPTICARLGRFMLSEIFFHHLAELLLRARSGSAGLVHHLGEFRRRHRLVGEGIESLLHFADHRLPDAAGSLPLSAIGALPVGYERLPRFACFGPYHTVAAGRSTARSAMRRKPSAMRQTVA